MEVQSSSFPHDPHAEPGDMSTRDTVGVSCGQNTDLHTTTFSEFPDSDTEWETVIFPSARETFMEETQPLNIAPSMKDHFRVSKYFVGSSATFPYTYSQYLSSTAKLPLDTELPNTRLKSSTGVTKSELALTSQTYLQSTSCELKASDYTSSATRRPDSYPTKISELYERLDSSHLVAFSNQAFENGSELDAQIPSKPKTLPDLSDTQIHAELLPFPVAPAHQPLRKSLAETQLLNQQPAHFTDGGSPLVFSASEVIINLQSEAEKPLSKVSCKERKRIIISPTRPPNVTRGMTNWVDKTNRLLDPFRDDDDCWLHPSPPSPRAGASGILRPVGTLQRRFAWKDQNGRYSIVLNYGIVVKLINHQLTKQQQDGLINKKWHLSHLCGNWTCLNPAHTTVEEGAINIGRNKCFSHRSGCLHTPKCLKEKKLALGPDGKLINHSDHVAPAKPHVRQLVDWSSPLLLDEEGFVRINFNDSESVDQDEMDAADFRWPTEF